MSNPEQSQTPEGASLQPRPRGRFRFRRVNEITGTFVLLVIALLIATVVWTARSQRWFKRTVDLRIILPEEGAAGIRQGSEVYFLGTLVGSVSDVLVDETGRMEALASIRHDFFLFVRADSSAVVKKKFGVAGDSFFELTRGIGPPLPEKNASIICKQQFQSGFESAIEEIRAEALLVLKKAGDGFQTWNDLGADLGETRQRLEEVAAQIESIAAGIEAGKGTVGTLLKDTAVADQTEHLLTQANQAMQELQRMVTNANTVVQNLQAGTERLPEITDAVATGAKDLPALIQQTQRSMHETQRLVEALQRHWLVRKYVAPGEVTTQSDWPGSGRLPKAAARLTRP